MTEGPLTEGAERRQWLNRRVALPRGLTAEHINRVVASVENEVEQFVDVYFEQANVFSALVGIFAARAFSALTVYEKPRHADLAQQRFPDLKRRGAPDPPPPDDSLEIKASIRPWALQAHYDHPGWYCVLRYLVDPSRTIEAGKYAVVWRVHIARLEQADWKYEGSGAGPQGGGRTHTYGVIKPANRFKDAAVFSRPDIVISRGKVVPRNGG